MFVNKVNRKLGRTNAPFVVKFGFLFLICFLFSFLILEAQTPLLLNDCVLGSNSSNPQNIVVGKNNFYFSADNGKLGDEPWISDGTSANTKILKNIGYEGFRSKPHSFCELGETVFFVANDEKHGYELWKTNVKEQETKMVKDINSGKYSSQPQNLIAFNQMLYFITQNKNANCKLWSSNGEEEQTQVKFDFGADVVIMGVIKTESVLILAGQKNGQVHFWLLQNNEIQVLNVQNMALENISLGLKVLKLSLPANKELKNNELIKFPDFFNKPMEALDETMDNNNLYFILKKEKNIQLYKTDASLQNPQLIEQNVADNHPKNQYKLSSSANGVYLATYYYTTNEIKIRHWNSKNVFELIYTKKLVNIQGFELQFHVFNKALLFNVPSQDSFQSIVLYAISSKIEQKLNCNGNGNIRSVSHFFEFNNKVYAVVDDGTIGSEIWSLQPSGNRLTLLIDINTKGNDANPMALSNINGALCFLTNSLHQIDVWHYDIKSKKCVSIKTIKRMPGDEVKEFYAINNQMYFFLYSPQTASEQFWITDGTALGTRIVKTLYLGREKGASGLFLSQTFEKEMVFFNQQIFFTFYSQNEGQELWKTNGTANGTVIVKDIYKGKESSNPEYLTVYNGSLYFAASTYNDGRELWVSDGTNAGTKMFKDVWYGAQSGNPSNLKVCNSKLYFAATVSENFGNEICISNGTKEGTTMLFDINNKEPDSNPDNFIELNGLVLFTADNGKQGTELWKTDGSSKGTEIVKDIFAGGEGSAPNSLLLFDNKIHFEATDKNNGNELWRTDATEKGTKLIDDISHGEQSSLINNICVTDTKLFFTARNKDVYNQLFYYDKNKTNIW